MVGGEVAIAEEITVTPSTVLELLDFKNPGVISLSS